MHGVCMLFVYCLRNPESLDDIKKGDTVIVVDPGPRGEWFACSKRFKYKKAWAFGRGEERVQCT